MSILILEDIPTDTELVVNELREAELKYELTICRSNEELKEQLGKCYPDIILTPYSLEYTNAVKALKLFRNCGCTAPIILLAQDLSEDIAIELLKTGIEDYVLRSTLKRLPIAMKKALLKNRTHNELQVSKDMVRASQASLVNMVRNMPMAVAMFDTEMHYLVVSDLWLEHEGFSEKELIGKSHYKVVPGLPDHWKAIHAECLKGAIRTEEQEKMIQPDGSVSYLRWKINPWYSPEGKIGGIVLFTEDVTAKVTSAEKIHMSERSLRLAMEVGGIGTFQVNLKTDELTWSEELYVMADIDHRHITIEDYFDLFHPEDRERTIAETRQRIKTGQPEVISYRVVTGKGNLKYIETRASILKDDEGNPVSLIGIAQDVTANTISEEKVRNSERSLRLAMEVGQIGTFELNLESGELTWSDQLFEMAMVKRQTVTKDFVKSILHPDDRERVTAELESRATTGKPENVAYRIITENGEIKHIETTASFVKGSKGEDTVLLGIAQDVTGKKLMAIEVSQNERRLRLAIGAAKLGVWEWHVENNTLSCDKRCYEIIGHPNISILEPEHLFDIVHPEDQGVVRKAFKERSENRTDLDVNMRTVAADGTIKQFILNAEFRGGNADGRSVMYGVIRDRTKVLKAQEKLAQNEEVFRQLAEHITEVFYLTDITTNKVLFVSETFEEVYGLTVEELYEDSFSWSKNIHPDDQDRVKTKYHDNAREGMYDEEYRLVSTDGSIKWVRDRAFPVINEKGEVVRIAGLSEDITQRITNERKIEMLSQVASETINGVLIHDQDGLILWSNDAFTEITGYKRETIAGKEPWDFLSGPETDQNLIKLTYESVRRKRAFTSENILYKLDGSKVWISTNFTPILDSNNEVCRIVSVGTDVTQIKENERLQKESMHNLEGMVKERTSLLETANLKLMDEITAREKVSSALAVNNTDLLDSMNYAEKIQRAILPNKTALLKSFDSAFILSKARNVVSGDFHWFHHTEEHTFVAAVDCTGHGVPGALMSMIGYQLLDQAMLIEHNANPASILDKLDELIRKSLKQNGQEGAIRDGMDIGLCVINNHSLAMSYAGAFNSLYHVNSGNVDMINGNRHSIGGHMNLEYDRSFTAHDIQLQRGDKLYLSTDGFVDQFGGPLGKKFMKRRFKELIQNIQSFAFSDHKEKMQSEFENWQGPLSQVDDMLVIGMKI